MATHTRAATESEPASRRLIDLTHTILSGLSGNVPHGFVAQFFARAASEDLAAYEPRELAALAEDAWLFLQDRRPGTPRIRVESRDAPAGGDALQAVTVVEIVNDDMPFLFDSVMGELNEHGVEIRLVVHPVFTVERDVAGALIGFRGDGPTTGAAVRESFIHIHIERIEDDVRRAAILEGLSQALADVRVGVRDWRTMLTRISAMIAEMKSNPPPLPVEDIAEAVQFLEWLVANNFTFLGLRDYAFTDANATDIQPLSETGLGILRAPEVLVLRRGSEHVAITPEIREFLSEPRVLIITKANMRSRVHRRVHMDYIGIKRFDAEGRLAGELRIVGLFTSTVYTRSTRSIPYLRRKVDAVLARAGFDADGHSGKALVNVLESYPRDELFQIDEETLFRFALLIMQLDERPRVRVLARRDRFDRFVSVLVYVPRERYDSSVRIAIGSFLTESYKGRLAAYYPYFPEGPLVRVHFIIGRTEGLTPDVSRVELEHAVAAIVRTWSDELSAALRIVHDPLAADTLFRRYREAFPLAYREAYAAEASVSDIRMIERLTPARPLGVDFYGGGSHGKRGLGLKVWNREQPMPLSTRVPVLENMGFKVVEERTYRINPGNGEDANVWLHDMGLERADGKSEDFEPLKQRLEACFLAVMQGLAESDGYNALVLEAGLQWRDVALVRSVSRFLRQVRIAYSQDYMWLTLRKHPDLAALIVRLFHTRFDPRLELQESERKSRCAQIEAELEASLATVQSLDEDRIVRRLLNAVQAVLRTNFYQLDASGLAKTAIALKLDSRRIDGLPLPRPLYEVFVYGPRVEGVHMRFGKVARGGLRWSDRPQDFRTEVLGLAKAQQVKNAVIVPVGAKGGFVPKRLPSAGTREAIQAEVVATYVLFVSSLLDVTDNIVPAGTSTPAQVVRYDDDDPYLVVAADKGTATFSDTANAVSAQYGFWLGDAFASGGSAGYDHKKIAITARGAWEAVKRHFREINVDVMKQPFSVAGVGDMSGDVFGNGMLRTPCIRLVAAFDHRDIFIDPDPDPQASFEERRRLFDLPRSSWQDYDRARISEGGGVYSRGAKEIRLSERAQTMLGLAQPSATPPEVMNAILRMNVDLLWFGGIGTYIRSSQETDEQVGDRANDAIRVKAADLRCRVIGEGANLGMTQRGRVEAAQHGVRLNTDAIDNSGGVNSSDLEVNLKVALGIPMRDGRLTMEARNALLAEMTDEVAALVLRNNYLQTLALSLAQRRGLEDLGFQQRLIQKLEGRGLLDRSVEFLPDDAEIASRRLKGMGLTRPETAVLLAYAKLSLYAELLGSAVPDDPYLGRELERYFPRPMVERFPDAVAQHRLRREIIATQLSNAMINRGGPSLIVRISDQTAAGPAAIAVAFAAVRDSFSLTALNAEIDALDAKIGGEVQLALYAAVQDLLLDRVVWFLRNVDMSKGLRDVVDHYRVGIETVDAALRDALPADDQARRDSESEALSGAGVPADLSRRIATLPYLLAAPDIVLVSDRSGRPVDDVAATYLAAGAHFDLDRIREAARGIAVADHFDRLALDRAKDSIARAERRITTQMLQSGASGQAAVDHWTQPRLDEVERVRREIHDIARSGLTLSKLSVVASLLGDLVKE